MNKPKRPEGAEHRNIELQLLIMSRSAAPFYSLLSLFLQIFYDSAAFGIK